ncbi:MAG: ATP phosphoribosyltransferase [SAR202 cluster bacterium]|nr:ATP phosphoribosyltransferase [SAR202 cluster bacterium]
MLRIALPSDGALHEDTLGFLQKCGLAVKQTSKRSLTGSLRGVRDNVVLFQRTADITSVVEQGSAELGVVGLDRYLEYRRDGTDAIVVMDNLSFGRCDLVIAVPDEWVDVTSVADLADVSLEFLDKGHALRVATKYPRLVERFLLANDTLTFTIVHASGALEAAPSIGYADIIADITDSGATLRENSLRRLDGGTIMTSHAGLIANRALLRADPSLVDTTRSILERLEARLRAERTGTVRATLRPSATRSVPAQLNEMRSRLGVESVAIQRGADSLYDGGSEVTVVADRAHIQNVVDLLRAAGANLVTVGYPESVFQSECQAYQRMLSALQEAAHA